jgi:hypothetical protein
LDIERDEIKTTINKCKTDIYDAEKHITNQSPPPGYPLQRNQKSQQSEQVNQRYAK